MDHIFIQASCQNGCGASLAWFPSVGVNREVWWLLVCPRCGECFGAWFCGYISRWSFVSRWFSVLRPFPGECVCVSLFLIGGIAEFGFSVSSSFFLASFIGLWGLVGLRPDRS